MDVGNGESRGRSESTNMPRGRAAARFFGKTRPPGGLKNNYFFDREKQRKKL